VFSVCRKPRREWDPIHRHSWRRLCRKIKEMFSRITYFSCFFEQTPHFLCVDKDLVREALILPSEYGNPDSLPLRVLGLNRAVGRSDDGNPWVDHKLSDQWITPSLTQGCSLSQVADVIIIVISVLITSNSGHAVGDLGQFTITSALITSDHISRFVLSSRPMEMENRKNYFRCSSGSGFFLVQ